MISICESSPQYLEEVAPIVLAALAAIGTGAAGAAGWWGAEKGIDHLTGQDSIDAQNAENMKDAADGARYLVPKTHEIGGQLQDVSGKIDNLSSTTNSISDKVDSVGGDLRTANSQLTNLGSKVDSIHQKLSVDPNRPLGSVLDAGEAYSKYLSNHPVAGTAIPLVGLGATAAGVYGTKKLYDRFRDSQFSRFGSRKI